MKLTKEGIAVIEGDEYLSADIIAQGRLDVQRDLLLPYRQYIPEGGVVIDVGACLGDTAATLSEFVGPNGTVVAFEPNPLVYECLLHNTAELTNILIYPYAIGNEEKFVGLTIDQHNIGASYLSASSGLNFTRLLVRRLDDWVWSDMTRLDFIKIDAEGYEPWILDGGVQTINRFRPVMLIEIDLRALCFQKFVAEDVFTRLDALNYSFERFTGPHGNILCLPK